MSNAKNRLITVAGAMANIAAMTPTIRNVNLETTLNAKYGIAPTETLGAGEAQQILYVGAGIKGFRAVNDSSIVEPNRPIATNMDLYEPIPIRCVPVEADLDVTERANYRMRVVKTIGTEEYVLYYLKKLVFPDTSISLTHTVDGIEQTYNLDPSNLTPTPPTLPLTGSISDIENEIDVYFAGQATLTGAELLEGINVLYDGDLRYAHLSEIGYYMGVDFTHTVNDFEGTPFNYTEAKVVQLAIHECSKGSDMADPTATETVIANYGTTTGLFPA